MTGASGSESGGMTGSGGAPSNGGTSSSGGAKGAAGTTGSAGKGGSSSTGGASAGGSTSSGGKGGTTGVAGSTGSAGKGGGGSTGTTPCDASHAVATVSHAQTFTGKANDCVRLSVNPNYASIALDLNAQPGTQYPVPFTYTSCAGNGTGKLTADGDDIFKTSSNPGCDYYVQFTGGSTTLKFVYYD